MMAYLYPVIWFAAGLIMIFKLRQENKIFIFAGFYFLFLGGWWLTNILYPDYHMFSGNMGWILRGVTALALAVVGVAFYREKKRTEAMLENDKEEQSIPNDTELEALEPVEPEETQEAEEKEALPEEESSDTHRED